MTIIDHVTGLILAGGRGSRMGNVDKGLQRFRNSTMVAHVLRRLAPQVTRVVINANQNRDAYAVFGAPVWPDDLAGFAGPLAGLETGLRRCTTEFLVTAPCDAPFLPGDLVARLHQALVEGNADLALAETEEADENGAPRIQPQPVFALMKTELLPILSAYLELGGRRMDGWYSDIKVVRVRFDDAGAFRNINTAADLQKYEEQA
jgi:molybdenum cofactor guanylyltransferase